MIVLEILDGWLIFVRTVELCSEKGEAFGDKYIHYLEHLASHMLSLRSTPTEPAPPKPARA